MAPLPAFALALAGAVVAGAGLGGWLGAVWAGRTGGVSCYDQNLGSLGPLGLVAAGDRGDRVRRRGIRAGRRLATASREDHRLPADSVSLGVADSWGATRLRSDSGSASGPDRWRGDHRDFSGRDATGLVLLALADGHHRRRHRPHLVDAAGQFRGLQREQCGVELDLRPGRHRVVRPVALALGLGRARLGPAIGTDL